MSRITAARRIRTQLPQVCVQCAAIKALTIDHIIPRVYGGSNELTNLQMLCLPCHREKSRTEVRHHNPAKNQRKGQELALALAPIVTSLPDHADEPHLTQLLTTMEWATVAVLLQTLGWRWYAIPGRNPHANEIRATAASHLTGYIHEARTNGHNYSTLRTGGLEYSARTCPLTGAVLNLHCAFVPIQWQSSYPSHPD